MLVALCRASYYISLLGLKIPCALLVRSSYARYVLAFMLLFWVPFLGFCHVSLLPQVQEISADSAVHVWHVLTALWITIPMTVVGVVILSFVNGRGPALAFFAAFSAMGCFHGLAISRIAQTQFGNVLLHALFAFFEDMPIIGWIWCLVYVVRLQNHIELKRADRKGCFTTPKDSNSNNVLIVGNAPTVTEGEPLGELMDTFNHVVRFNQYSMSQPEFTGNKVTHHFCNGRNFPTSNTVTAVCPLFNASLTHAVYLFMPHMEEAAAIYANLTSAKVDAWFVEEERILSLRRKIGCALWQIPTSGMVAVDAFLDSRGEVTLHGFNFFQGKKIHYFQESPTQLITSWLERFVTHDPACEKVWVEALVQKGIVSFLVPQQPVEGAGDVSEKAAKKGGDDNGDVRRRTPGIVRTVLKDGFPSQFSL